MYVSTVIHRPLSAPFFHLGFLAKSKASPSTARGCAVRLGSKYIWCNKQEVWLQKPAWWMRCCWLCDWSQVWADGCFLVTILIKHWNLTRGLNGRVTNYFLMCLRKASFLWNIPLTRQWPGTWRLVCVCGCVCITFVFVCAQVWKREMKRDGKNSRV